MAEGLFDSRYRYDFIYPRGRSGETLRAVDSQDGDRPVVIKRPAPQDAPPIRAGQEVSILNERKALSRLAGHAVSTLLLGGGQFAVGGMAHQYIVMERAEGQIVAEMVSELAQHGARLPDLEILIIIDHLLDLLYTAHQHDIVYNDVDAKHLFWDRDRYRLKVIDWGNAVFLEGDEVTAQGISRQTDVYQVGELLFFILSGAGRAEVPRDAGDDFRVDFGDDNERVPTRLQKIISRALHPNPRLRYSSITEMRRDLSDYRVPIERERSAVVARASERLRRELSKDELTGLAKALEPALAMDPGYPPARTVVQEIQNRQNDLEVAADLDAARIYLESGAWTRAMPILSDLRPRARGDLAILIGLLSDWALLLSESTVPPDATVYDALMLAFERQLAQAAARLMAEVTPDTEITRLHLLLAERISAHSPDILLLRANLFRLQTALQTLDSEGVMVGEPRAFLRDIDRELGTLENVTSISLITLRDGYRALVDQMTALNKFLGTVRTQHQLSNARLPLSSLDRAINATMALADNMHIIGKQATNSPRDALNALEYSRAIDPSNRAWDGVRRLLDNLYGLLESYQTYVPVADGSDLAQWLHDAQTDLAPFLERLFDEMLVGMTLGLRLTSTAWGQYADTVIQGNRIAAITALAQGMDAVSTVAPSLAGWLNQLRSLVTNATYIERHALFGGLGRALADGWDQFDRGKLVNAEQLATQAYDIARADGERDAARRLRTLSEITREWVERGGIADSVRTQAALMQVELLYTPDEISTRDSFAAQMPGKETFLKAMGKGLVELFTRQSTAALRILFVNYALLGALDAHDDHLEDADFWQAAAVNTLVNAGATHPLVTTLSSFIQRRRDLLTAATLLNSINGLHAMALLETTRAALEENQQARALAPALYGLRELAASQRDWADGEFRAAGNKLENTLRTIDEIESSAGITLTAYRTWLMTLIAATADLHTNARRLTQIIEKRDAEPQPAVLQIHQNQVSLTERLIGTAHTATLRLWRDTYEKFLAVYTDSSRRSARLAQFNDLFRAMFIDRHPAYPLYRHWYDLTEQAPEFPAPPTDQPTPLMTDIVDDEAEPRPYIRLEAPTDSMQDSEPAARRGVPLILILGVPLLLAIIVAVIALTVNNGGGDAQSGNVTAATNTGAVVLAAATTPSISATRALPTSATPTPPEDALSLPTRPRVTAAVTLPATSAPVTLDFPTQIPSLTPILPTATRTPTFTPSPTLTATPTPTPSVTHTPTVTATASATWTPSPPPGGVRGDQDLFTLLDSLAAVSAVTWTPEVFSRGIDGDFWRLGVGAAEQGSDILIGLPPTTLEGRFGENAGGRVLRMVADLELVTFNPPLVIDQQVYFGLMLSPPDAPADGIGVQISLVDQGVFNIGQRRNGTAVVNVQRSVGAPIARIRIERDFASGLVAMYVNDEQIGTPIRLENADAVLQPTVFIRRGGVIVHVNRWQVTLR